jgi:hypothetical protein
MTEFLLMLLVIDPQCCMSLHAALKADNSWVRVRIAHPLLGDQASAFLQPALVETTPVNLDDDG